MTPLIELERRARQVRNCLGDREEPEVFVSCADLLALVAEVRRLTAECETLGKERAAAHDRAAASEARADLLQKMYDAAVREQVERRLAP